jgi:hypothetical protein
MRDIPHDLDGGAIADGSEGLSTATPLVGSHHESITE